MRHPLVPLLFFQALGSPPPPYPPGTPCPQAQGELLRDSLSLSPERPPNVKNLSPSSSAPPRCLLFGVCSLSCWPAPAPGGGRGPTQAGASEGEPLGPLLVRGHPPGSTSLAGEQLPARTVPCLSRDRIPRLLPLSWSTPAAFPLSASVCGFGTGALRLRTLLRCRRCCGCWGGRQATQAPVHRRGSPAPVLTSKGRGQ